MHNSANYFAAHHHAAKHFAGGGAGDTGATVRTYWSKDNRAWANQSVDYFVFSSLDGFVTSGSGMTDSSGWLAIEIPLTYAGESVQVVVNNLSADMSTSGRVHGQQVAVAS